MAPSTAHPPCAQKSPPPCRRASGRAPRKYDLRTSGARVRGRTAQRSGGGCQKRVWTAVSAPWVPDTGTGRLPRKRVTNFSTGFPRALRLKGVRAALGDRGQRRVPFDPATGAARSGPALTRLWCQRPAGKRQDMVDVERPSNPDLQLAHQLPGPAHDPPPAAPCQRPPLPSSAWFFATAAAPAPIAAPLAPYDPLLTVFLPPMGDPPPGL